MFSIRKEKTELYQCSAKTGELRLEKSIGNHVPATRRDWNRMKKLDLDKKESWREEIIWLRSPFVTCQYPEGRMEKPESGIRNRNRNPNLRNKSWRRCSIKTFHPHIIFIYCYYIFYCRIFCVRRKIFFENFIYAWAMQLGIMIDMSTPPPFAAFSSQWMKHGALLRNE